jgi:hypothetical protein
LFAAVFRLSLSEGTSAYGGGRREAETDWWTPDVKTDQKLAEAILALILGRDYGRQSSIEPKILNLIVILNYMCGYRQPTKYKIPFYCKKIILTTTTTTKT